MIEKHALPVIALLLSAFILQTGCGTGKSKNETSDSTPARIQPSPPIPVFKANSPKEKAALDDPFVGITTDGVPEDGLFSITSTGVSTKPVQDAVQTFLSSLSEEDKSRSTFPVENNEWRRWHNIESYQREGMALFEMDENQRALAYGILAASLSPEGVSKAKNIMAMEEYLKAVSIELGNPGGLEVERLGNDKYYFTFMGTPSDTEPWGWQIDGHHLVINYFILGDQVVMTPTFMGSELTHIEEGPDAGTRTFVEEGKKGLALFRSLDENQKKSALLLDSKEMQYNQTEAFRDNAVVPYAGIKANELKNSQKDLLIDLIEEYVGNMKHDHATIKMNEVIAHMDHTWFSWVGGSGDQDVFYYRIQSPVLLIEYDHHNPVFVVEEGAPNPGPVNWHVHTVVRTPNGNDYGKDLLKQHLEEHHHH